MLWVCLALLPVALAIAFPITALLIAISRRLRMFDSAGVPGQIKAQRRAIPNTGGAAIVAAIVLPALTAVIAAHALPASLIEDLAPALSDHLPGIRAQTPLALTFIACLLGLHIVGLIDDRRPMGPWVKLAIMVIAASVVVIPLNTRLLTMLDAHVGGPWLSWIVSITWIVVITNAMNFMDNMDGLSAGVSVVAGTGFLIAALVNEPPQWFVASGLALLVGSCLGFLAFNKPPAKIFMGDGGSLVLGFSLGFLTVRTTYYTTDAAAWYAVFMPLVVLAVPLYDFASVVLLRLSQGRSPFVGDLQHFSHRLVQRGLSKPAAVLVIIGCTCITAISGVALGSLRPWQAALVGVQTMLILALIAIFEWSSRRGSAGGGMTSDMAASGGTATTGGMAAAQRGCADHPPAQTDPPTPDPRASAASSLAMDNDPPPT